MSRDRIFTRDEDYREISDRDLYYDLGYQLTHKQVTEVKTHESIILYLFGVSVLLNFLFSINQIITIAVIVLYGVLLQYFPKIFQVNQKLLLLGIMLVGNILDHTISDIVILPGTLVTSSLSPFVWVLEMVWILLFGVELLAIFAPVQDKFTEERTISPATPEVTKNFNSLKSRVDGTDYNLTDFDEEVDTSLLQETFRDQVKFLIGSFLIIIFLDILIWRIVSIISGGNNIEEAYFVSGISFLVYIGIMIYSGSFFSDEKSAEKN